MSRLYLVGSGRERGGLRPRRWTPAPFDLERQPQRPGELCREIRLDVGVHEAVVAAAAAAAGVPVSLWATVAVESQRCVGLTSALFAAPDAVVITALDDAAAEAQAHPGEQDAVSASRLCEYGRALARARAHPPERTTLGGVLLRPSLRILTAWSLASEEAGVALEAWASGLLKHPVGEAARWEASAALVGQTLAEWTLVQAARRLRCASTFAQIAG
jgi:predicted HicB family RNase H-like nuclease